MRAVILNIGDEVLSGITINTNSSYLAEQLNKLSIQVERIIVIGDEEETIKREINEFRNSDYDLLITTGGLGPTHDDITKEAITSALGLELVLNEEVLERINKYFYNDAPKSNLKQAYFPKNSVIVKNELGTADGVIIPHVGKHYMILVGPPYELYPMFENTCMKYLEKLQEEKTLITEYLVMGGGESFFEDYLDELLKGLKNVSLSPYASVGKIRFLLKAKEKDKQEYLSVKEKFESLMADYIVSTENEEVEEVLVKYLKKYDLTISIAESITGGMIASHLVNVSGVSKHLKESLVTYSDEAKIKYLGVSNKTLNKFGAVSQEVVIEMVAGLKEETNADIVVATTGYAGPDGEEDKIGLVYFGIIVNNKLHVFHKQFRGNRNMIRTRATLFTLFKVLSLIKQSVR